MRQRLLSPVLALLLLPSCAITYFNDFATTNSRTEYPVARIVGSDGSVQTVYEPGPSENYMIACMTGVVWAPCALAWDLVTWPFQWILGYHPFGEKGKYTPR